MSAFPSVTDKLPRFALAHLPTPLHDLPNLTAHLGGPALFVKRDDETGLATGGNKARKLEFLIAEAKESGADTVITAGSTQSNHARQTAAAAARAGLACHLVLYAPDARPPQRVEGNVLLDTLLGATLHWTDEKAPYVKPLAIVEEEIRAAGKKPHVIPYGGSSALGLMGYVRAMEELAAQTKDQPPFDAVVFATSSGGTQAGMMIGAKVAGLIGKTRLLGISVDMSARTLHDRITQLVREGCQKLGVEWDGAGISKALHINDNYIGGGYAVVGDPEREAIRLLARKEGILADPVYTGRALAGLLDLIRKDIFKKDQRVLFWHTGGSAALFAFEKELLAT